MRIHVLYGQRLQRYEGEFLPELLDAVDEGTLDENPGVMSELRAKHQSTKEFAGVEWFAIEMPDGALPEIRRRLAGIHPLGNAAALTHARSGQ